ncbi:MAG: protein-L-isoaspartate(D-aspartate) O-methyltransferase [Polyangiaceae bacterium]|nr:protein-L-isoaspartate(D-aspartate) O-methyltransferase [Polyangiaceae bacterium]
MRGFLSARCCAIAVPALLTACTSPEPVSHNAASKHPLAGARPTGSSAGAASARRGPFAARVAERRALVRQLAEEGIADRRVLDAMRTVPRHAFVPAALQAEAYADHPLPIGHDQTISQPFIVAAMTEAARPKPTSKCLEIGTGSGYQAAVLSEVCGEVYSIEYLPDVAAFGEKNLRRLGYGPDRVHLRVGDGYQGWPTAAPFDVVIVTAAPEEVPPPLLEQLAVGGKLIIPVGPGNDVQYLERWTRLKPGADPDAFDRDELMGVNFVPFLGQGASERD